MISHPTMHRRTMIKLTSCVLLASPMLSCSGPKGPLAFFSAKEAKIVEAICDRIIPADDTPGAIEAGVLFFLDTQLRGFYAYFQPMYRRGIPCLEKTCQMLYSRSFLELAPDQQDDILGRLERDEAPSDAWGDIPQRAFFSTLRDHTMQGFYGSPRHGGNKNFCSWRMLGLPHPPLRGRLLYDKSKKETLFG
jgi:gluconate 2-dehydrogenase gamma chain